jgi:hypothetical protein
MKICEVIFAQRSEVAKVLSFRPNGEITQSRSFGTQSLTPIFADLLSLKSPRVEMTN